MADRWRDPDVLREMYEKHGSIRGVARELDAGRGAVGRQMEDFGIKPDHNRAEITKLKDADWLRREYVEKDRTLADIADERGCDKSTVANYLDEHDIEARTGSPPRAEIDGGPEQLHEDYVEKGMTRSELAEKHDVSEGTIQRRMLEWDIATRRVGPENPPTGADHHLYEHGNGHSIPRGPEWSVQRRKALERDDYRCVVCGMTMKEQRARSSKGLNVHHIIRREDFRRDETGEIDWDAADSLNNLITLCHKHHEKWEGIPLRPDSA